MKSFMVLLALVSLAGCGKKVDDIGPNFTLKPIDANIEKSTLTRSDAEKGVAFHLEGVDLNSISYIDKKLTCGPVTFFGRRDANGSTGFGNLFVSESEFKGLNTLPKEASCELTAIITNGKGSTVSKSIHLNLNFDVHPALVVTRWTVGLGLNPVPSDPGKLLLETFEITNPFSYPVWILVKPGVSADLWPRFKFQGDPSLNLYYGTGPFNMKGTILRFNPPTTSVLGDQISGYFFRVQPNTAVQASIYGEIPPNWIEVKLKPFIQTGFISVPPSTAVQKNRFLDCILIRSTQQNSTIAAARSFELTQTDMNTPDPLPIQNNITFPFLYQFEPNIDPLVHPNQVYPILD